MFGTAVSVLRAFSASSEFEFEVLFNITLFFREGFIPSPPPWSLCNLKLIRYLVDLFEARNFVFVIKNFTTTVL